MHSGCLGCATGCELWLFSFMCNEFCNSVVCYDLIGSIVMTSALKTSEHSFSKMLIGITMHFSNLDNLSINLKPFAKLCASICNPFFNSMYTKILKASVHFKSHPVV